MWGSHFFTKNDQISDIPWDAPKQYERALALPDLKSPCYDVPQMSWIIRKSCGKIYFLKDQF